MCQVLQLIYLTYIAITTIIIIFRQMYDHHHDMQFQKVDTIYYVQQRFGVIMIAIAVGLHFVVVIAIVVFFVLVHVVILLVG